MTENPMIHLSAEKRVVIRWENPKTGRQFHSEFVSKADDLTILTYCKSMYRGRRRRLLSVAVIFPTKWTPEDPR